MKPLPTFALPLAVVLASSLTGCRGNKTAEPPVHLVQNMDFQQYYKPQEANAWFQDGRASRPFPKGTVARDLMRAGFDARAGAGKPGPKNVDRAFFTGRGDDGRLVDGLPASVPLSDALLARGEARYDIYCAPCHEASGYGQGIIVQRGLKVPPPSFHDPRLQAMPLGYFFDVITHGKNTMKPYAAQVPPDDRWAIAAWLRVLQVSQRAELSDIPEAERAKIERGAP